MRPGQMIALREKEARRLALGLCEDLRSRLAMLHVLHPPPSSLPQEEVRNWADAGESKERILELVKRKGFEVDAGECQGRAGRRDTVEPPLARAATLLAPFLSCCARHLLEPCSAAGAAAAV